MLYLKNIRKFKRNVTFEKKKSCISSKDKIQLYGYIYLLQTTFSSSAISSLVVAQLVTKRQMVW